MNWGTGKSEIGAGAVSKRSEVFSGSRISSLDEYCAKESMVQDSPMRELKI